MNHQHWSELKLARNHQYVQVLATVVSTQGSTYQKAGHMVLIDEAGCHGLISGGCLEEDLRFHALDAIEKRQQKTIHYDLSDNEDSAFQLGLGCEGQMTVLLQPLFEADSHLGFDEILQSIFEGHCGYLIQQINSEQPTALRWSTCLPYEAQGLTAEQKQWLDQGRSQQIIGHDGKQLLCTFVRPPLQLAVCGAGIDSIPLVQLAVNCGWQVTVLDHREMMLSATIKSPFVKAVKTRPSAFELSRCHAFDAAVIMTHRLDYDQQWLSKWLASRSRYIGLLGPPARKEKLFTALRLTEHDIGERVFGPVGLDIGAIGPQTLAVSIVAEIQRVFSKAKRRIQCN